MTQPPARPLSRETLAVSAGYDPGSAGGAAKPPIHMTSTFVAPTAAALKAQHELFFEGRASEAGYIYARLGHPNLSTLEARVAALDGAEDAACFATGMASISTTLLAFARPGETILHSEPIYGGTDNLVYNELSRLGISGVGFADGLDGASIRAAAERAMAKGPLAVVWVESPANPLGLVSDIALVAEIVGEIEAAQGRRPLLAVDNTFLGPFLQSPLSLGADLCMTSLTKYAAGHSDLLAGAISGPAALLSRLKLSRTILGTVLDPHTAWLVARSIETMALRTERAVSNASKVAAFLAEHPKVRWLSHLGHLDEGSAARDAHRRQARGHGSTFSFKIRGGEREAFAMLDALSVMKLAVSLGGTETLICHSASTTHYSVLAEKRARMGIDESSIRISVGIEDPEDLLADLARGLDAF